MLFKYKYPKLTLLVLAIILAYILFRNPNVSGFVSGLGNLSYLGVFIAGLFFAFGFSAPFSVGFFITLNPENLILAGIIGGLGALLGDLFIFNLIKVSFKGEFNQINKTKAVKAARKFIKDSFGKKITYYLLLAFAGFFIASPLPDEVGVSLLAGLTNIKQGILAVISFTLNTLGIIVLLAI